MPTKHGQALAGRTVRCLLFDLGDTLWSRQDMAVWQRMEGAANARAVALLRASAACARLPEGDTETLGIGLRAAVDEHMRLTIRQNPEVEPDGALVVVQAMQQWGIEALDREVGAAIFEALRVRIPGSRPLYDDVLATLKVLQERGFGLGVVTNRHWGGKIFKEDLHTLGLLTYFDYSHMAISADLGVRKPNPAIFLHALNALAVAPEEAVMVGDSLRSDVLGAKLLGMSTIWKPKPVVLQAMYARQNAASTLSSNHYEAALALSSTWERPADLPAGMHVTDDDYVLAQVQADKWDEHMQSEIQPDMLIERLSDLLDIFVKVGKQ